jgi:hypothetical protein
MKELIEKPWITVHRSRISDRLTVPNGDKLVIDNKDASIEDLLLEMAKMQLVTFEEKT